MQKLPIFDPPHTSYTLKPPKTTHPMLYDKLSHRPVFPWAFKMATWADC